MVASVLTFLGSSVVILRLHSDAQFYTAAKMNNTSSALQLYQVALPPEAAVVNIFVNIFVLVSNLLAVMTFRKLEKLYIQHYFMLGLIGSDFGALIVNLVSTVMLLTQEIWLTETMCFLLSLLNVLARGTTAMLHTCLSIDRGMAVAFPITYRNINLNVPHKLTVIGIIVISLLPGFSIYLSWIFKQSGVYFDAYIPYCLDKAGELGGAGEVIAMFYTIIMPFLIEVPLNSYVIWRISTMQGSNRTRTLNVVKAVLVTLGAYYLCWLPCGVWFVWNIANPHVPISGWFRFFALQILSLNSGMGCIIYYFMLPKFKETLHLLLTQCCKS